MVSIAMRFLHAIAGASIAAAAFGGCDHDETGQSVAAGPGGAAGAGGLGGDGGAPIAPGPEFDRFCRGQPWDAALAPATAGVLGGDYLGVLMDAPPVGSLSTMKVIPAHPFHATTIRVAFGAGQGQARIRLMTTFGRSYPGGWPDIDAAGVNLIEPVDIEVGPSPDPEEWI